MGGVEEKWGKNGTGQVSINVTVCVGVMGGVCRVCVG